MSPTLSRDVSWISHRPSKWMELEFLWENEVYKEVPQPSGKVIGTKWVFRVKSDAAGNLDKFKAKVVAKGFRQVEGLDYEEKFAPIVRFESVRSLV